MVAIVFIVVITINSGNNSSIILGESLDLLWNSQRVLTKIQKTLILDDHQGEFLIESGKNSQVGSIFNWPSD